MQLKRIIRWYAMLPLCLAVTLSFVSENAQAELTFEPTWQVPEYSAVRQHVRAWLQQGAFDPKLVKQAMELWPTDRDSVVRGGRLLDRTVETIALVDDRAEALREACRAPYQVTNLPDGKFLDEGKIASFAKHNLALFLARWQAQRGLYDEVIETLEGIRPADVVDPGSLLFYRMVAFHQVVKPEESRAALVQLLEHEDSLPLRYRHVAQLLRHDLRGLQDESLDHIARRMNDVRRRLELGRAGDKVQMVEQDIMESLTKLIEKLEQQSQQSSSSAAKSSQQSDQPMQDSQLPSMNAPMQVDKKDIGNKSGWGDLPPKQREEALQQIGRDFPAHYRELIEQYFRELASEGEATEK